MHTRNRTSIQRKPKLARLILARAKRKQQEWFTTADDEGNVRVHPAK